MGKKKSKVLELKEIKTLRESIVKIEISVAELKIAANFKGIRTFPSILTQNELVYKLCYDSYGKSWICFHNFLH